MRAAELASLAVEAAPAGVVSDEIAGELLEGAGVVLVVVQSDGIRRLLLAAPRMERTPELVDLRRPNPAASLAAPFRTLGPWGPRMLRVVARPQFRKADFVEIVVSDAPLRRDLINYLLGLLGVTAFISVVAGVLIYLTLTYFLVRPIRKITESMERFAASPEDPSVRLRLSGRRDEIGRAEVELSRMQDDLAAALQSKARLAALGEAVAKINHDLRNMLTSAQMASERLAGSGDPRVTKALPRLERALDRAVRLAEDVLAYGRSEELAPDPRSVMLGPAVEAAGEDAGLSMEGHPLVLDIPEGFSVKADADHLHRILVNLFRNARQAMEAPGRPGEVRLTARSADGEARILVADQGPGVAPRAQAKLFQPFVSSARPGGAGLGLSISRELARANGGDVELLNSDEAGAVFELRLPVADPEGG